MTFKKFVINPCFLIILSAVLSALPLTFSNLFAVSWVSFVPLFYVIIRYSGNKFKSCFFYGFIFGFVYHLCVYYWFFWFYPLDYADLTNAASVGVVLLAVVGISLIHGLFWCLPFVCCNLLKRINRNPIFLCFTALVGIIAAEKLTALGELSFSWVKISLGQYRATALIQSLSIFGTDGLDMLILAVNICLTLFLISKSKKRFLAASLSVLLFSANLTYGVAHLNQKADGQNLNIMTVQASITQEEKWAADGDKICYKTYKKITTDNFTDGVDLVLWPESAEPTEYESVDLLKKYVNFSKKIDTPILTGILLSSDSGSTNNAVLIDRDGAGQIYSKRHLVPFGEFMPYQKIVSKVFPFLSELNIIEEDYICGTDSNIIELPKGNIGGVICFESIYPNLIRQSVNDGAQLIVELTNDSWLKDSPAMEQHLAHAVFRSVESGRYVVRSANSGISAVIDNCGRIKSTLDVNQKGVITDTVQFNSANTVYTKTGDIAFPIAVLLLLIFIIISIILKLRLKIQKQRN